MTTSATTFEQLLKQNERYIAAVANSFRRNDLFDELVQEGRISLYNSWNNYDESNKLSFEMYARPNLRYAMLNYLQQKSHTIKKSHNHKELDARFGPINVISGNLPLNESEDDQIFDLIPNPMEDIKIDEDILNRLKMGLNKLNEKRKLVIQLRFGLNGGEEMTYAEVGKKMGISKQAAQELVNKALKELKNG